MASMKMSLADKITAAVKLKFPEPSVTRVLECFERFNRGEELDVRLGDGNDDHNRQKANCYVTGLSEGPFFDVNNGKFRWLEKLQENAHIVQDEVREFLKNEREHKIESELWKGPRFVGTHYGPEWKTLGLQDRGLWDGENVDSFPKTVKLLHECKAPSCEAFFARQGPHSGIQAHSDLNNFILTAHLAIDVPEGKCWIRVGDEKHYWKNGGVCVFDTSIFHSTMNEADTDRFVLLIRFWHPDLSEAEVKAFSFIFDYLDHANYGEAALREFEMEHIYGIKPASANAASELSAVSVSASGESSASGLTRQQRREQERKLAKASKKAKGSGGFHRGG
jgi:Aspartyl/Asparaginyl beta-hydroxylase